MSSMTLGTLKKVISESVRASLVESEVYVDSKGYAHDDEGNTWYVGTRGAGETFKASDNGRRYGYGAAPMRRGGVPRYTTEPAPQSPGAKQLDAIKKLHVKLPNNNFVASVKSQLERGRSLSDKQKAVVVQIMSKVDMTGEAGLFA